MLTLSSPIVIYCEYMEPLSECFNYLMKYQLGVRMTISDTWMREFQTLPGRMHPKMHMPTSGGYFLSGIFIGSPSQVKAANKLEETKVYSAVAYPAEQNKVQGEDEHGTENCRKRHRNLDAESDTDAM